MRDDIHILMETFELFPDGLIIFDDKGKIVEFNGQAAQLFGYERKELEGRRIEDLIPPRYHTQHQKNFTTYLAEGIKREMGKGLKLKAALKNGSEIDVDIALSPLCKGSQAFVLAVVRDITDRLSMELKMASLEIVSNELKKFSYTVTHDLKAPLSQMKALVLLIEQAIKDHNITEEEELLSHLMESVRFMENLIHGILDSAVAGIDEQWEEVDTNLILNEVRSVIIVPNNFVIDLPRPLPRIHGNRTKIFQIFLNLITNAIKHNTKASGLLRIEWKKEAGNFIFSFSDNGVIVPKKERDNIFKLFYRIHKNQNASSHGLGLYIVKNNVEQAGGDIWYEESVFGGSAFWFRWPEKAENQEESIPRNF